VAHVGDGRCVLADNGRAVALTRDHKATDPNEIKRVVQVSENEQHELSQLAQALASHAQTWCAWCCLVAVLTGNLARDACLHQGRLRTGMLQAHAAPDTFAVSMAAVTATLLPMLLFKIKERLRPLLLLLLLLLQAGLSVVRNRVATSNSSLAMTRSLGDTKYKQENLPMHKQVRKSGHVCNMSPTARKTVTDKDC
jgi:serine/threonine protein phosphatase PrpC